jgi:hypothetical protein
MGVFSADFAYTIGLTLGHCTLVTLRVTLEESKTLLATTQIWGTGLLGQETEPQPQFFAL